MTGGPGASSAALPGFSFEAHAMTYDLPAALIIASIIFAFVAMGAE